MDANFPDLEALGFCDEDVIPGAMCKDGIWQIYDHERFDEWWNSEDSDVTVAKVWCGGIEVGHHYFRLPKYKDEGFYRTLTSYTWFREREREAFCKGREVKLPNGEVAYRPKKAQPCEIHTTFRSPSDRSFDHKSVQRLTTKLNISPEVPNVVQYHRNLWDVYKAIGYDYKKQKYDKEKYGKSTATAATSEPPPN